MFPASENWKPRWLTTVPVGPVRVQLKRLSLVRLSNTTCPAAARVNV